MKAALVLIPIVLLNGCYSFGSRKIGNPDVVGQIIPGKTTKAEVRKLVGSPTMVQLNYFGSGETWHYTYAMATVPILFMSATRNETLIVVFDGHGVVTRVAGGATGGSGKRSAKTTTVKGSPSAPLTSGWTEALDTAAPES